MSTSKVNKKLLNEFRHYTGLLHEQNDLQVVQDLLPGIQNCSSLCKEASDEITEVATRLQKLETLLKGNSDSLHLPAEAQFLHSKLRSSLHKILSSEGPIRKALTTLDSMN